MPETGNVTNQTYAERCMALVDMMREAAADDPALRDVLAMYDLLEK